MNIRWSPEAAADFVGIVEYIRNQNPSGLIASRTACTIRPWRSSLFPIGDVQAELTAPESLFWHHFRLSLGIESGGMRLKLRECCMEHSVGHEGHVSSFAGRC